MANINLNPVRFYTEDDVYHYTTDNRPLEDLASNDEILRQAIEELQVGGGEVVQNIFDDTNVSSVKGWTSSKINQEFNSRLTTKLDVNATAVAASKLETPRSISLVGDVTGSAFFDGSSDISIVTSTSSSINTDTVPEGSTNQYFTADRVRSVVLTGLSTATNVIITATDTVLSAFGKLQAQISSILSSLTAHISDQGNPHFVTKDQVGLGNVDNVSAADLRNRATHTGTQAISTISGLQDALNDKVDVSSIGQPNGVAPLDPSGLISSAYLPGFLEEVVEFSSVASFPTTGEYAKIYIALDTNKIYRWAGTSYEDLVASAGDTDAVPEGSSNLYFTAARVRSVVLTGLSTATNAAITAADTVLAAFGKLQAQISAVLSSLTNHIADDDNPHNVTKAQIGLGNVDNVSAADLRNRATHTGTQAISTISGLQDALDDKVDVSSIGQPSGVAPLDSSGLVPSTYLPSYVDDVLEFDELGDFPTSGESGKIYVALDTNKTYRWSGSAYVEIAASPGSTDAVPEGSTNQYFTAARVRAVVLTGLSTATNAVITAADSVLSAFGKLQAQISGLQSSKLDANANAVSASKLATARTIALSGDVTGSGSFDGSANLTITATVADDSHNHVISNVDGLQAALDDKLDADANAVSASKLATARTIALSGDVTGSGSFDGSANLTITATVADDSHNHVISNIDGLQAALDDKASLSSAQTFAAVQTFNNAIREHAVALGSGSTIDLNSGSYFTKTITGSTTLSLSNLPPSGTVASFFLELTNGGSATITFPANSKWAGGTPPILTASGVDILGATIADGSTVQWYVLKLDSK